MDEREHLERVLEGRAEPTLSPAGTMGRLAELYLSTPEQPDLPEKALVLVRAAQSLVAADDPLYPKLRHFEAMALRWVKNPQEGTLGLDGFASRIDQEAWETSYRTAPREAIQLAREWADWAWERDLWAEAGKGYGLAHRALRQHLLRRVRTGDRPEQQKHAKFATRGAYALAKKGDLGEALLLLERASDLAFAGQRQRNEIKEILQTYPRIGEELRSAMQSQIRSHETHGFDEFGNISRQEQGAQRRLDKIVARVRELPGFASFALPTSLRDVEEAAAVTPLVYLVATEKGSAAIAAKFADGRLGTAAADIPCTEAEIARVYQPFVRAEHGDVTLNRFELLNDVVKLIGARVMNHAAKALIELAAGQDISADETFYVIPYGVLAWLPLHAAGLPDPEGGEPQFLFRCGQVRFAFSARNLIASRRRKSTVPSGKALVVSDPKPLLPTFEELQLCEFEASLAQQRFSTTVLRGTDATCKAVTEAMAQKQLVHFVCHGNMDNQEMYAGALALARKEKFTAAHLRNVDLSSSKLVILSACNSGMPAIFIEHAQSLPAALLAAGAFAVIGTFWQSDEMASLALLGRFYQLLVDQGQSPADALGGAQKWLMGASAEDLRANVPREALDVPAGERLRDAPATEAIYRHPWFWANFFVSGA